MITGDHGSLRWSQVTIGNYRWSQVTVGNYRWSQGTEVIKEDDRWSQVTGGNYRWSHLTRGNYRWSQVTGCNYWWTQVITGDHRWLEVITCDHSCQVFGLHSVARAEVSPVEPHLSALFFNCLFQTVVSLWCGWGFLLPCLLHHFVLKGLAVHLQLLLSSVASCRRHRGRRGLAHPVTHGLEEEGTWVETVQTYLNWFKSRLPPPSQAFLSMTVLCLCLVVLPLETFSSVFCFLIMLFISSGSANVICFMSSLNTLFAPQAARTRLVLLRSQALSVAQNTIQDSLLLWKRCLQ